MRKTIPSLFLARQIIAEICLLAYIVVTTRFLSRTMVSSGAKVMRAQTTFVKRKPRNHEAFSGSTGTTRHRILRHRRNDCVPTVFLVVKLVFTVPRALRFPTTPTEYNRYGTILQ